MISIDTNPTISHGMELTDEMLGILDDFILALQERTIAMLTSSSDGITDVDGTTDTGGNDGSLC